VRRIFAFLFLLVSFLFSLALATNLFAFLNHHAHALGSPNFGTYFGPFRIIYWFVVLQVPRRVFLVPFVAFCLSFGFLSYLSFRMYTAFRLNIRGIYGNARWAKRSELTREGLFRAGRSAIVLGQSDEARFRKASQRKLARNPSAPPYRMLREGKIILNSDDKHILVAAPTRSGKGVSVIIPTLCSWVDSVVVYDIKKENFSVTSGFRRQFSHVLCFEPASMQSVRFNPLAEIANGKAAIAQVQNLCQTITNPQGDTAHDHWRESAAQLLVGVILYVLETNPSDRRNLSTVYGTLNDPEKPVKASDPREPSILADMQENLHPDPDCRRVIAQTARNMLNKAPNEFTSILSTASVMLSLYQDPIVARATSVSDFRISDLVDSAHPVSLYICVAPSDAIRMRPLVRVLLEQIMNALTARIAKHKHRLLLLLDEFPQLGRLESFESQLAFIAGYGIKAMLIVQSLSQLFKHYGERTSILDNCHYKAILGVGAVSDARYLSEALGTYSMNKKSVSHSGSIGSITAATRTTSVSESSAQLMNVDDLMRLPDTQFILLRKGEHPYRGKKIFFYLDRRFRGRCGQPTFADFAVQMKELPGYTRPLALPAPESAIGLPVPAAAEMLPEPARKLIEETETLAGMPPAPEAMSDFRSKPPISVPQTDTEDATFEQTIDDFIDI